MSAIAPRPLPNTADDREERSQKLDEAFEREQVRQERGVKLVPVVTAATDEALKNPSCDHHD